jgi:hypothetical protein
MDELPLMLDVLVEEFENVVLPLRDLKVKEVVSLLRFDQRTGKFSADEACTGAQLMGTDAHSF